MGSAILASLAPAPARDAIDWRQLDVWWGDERYLPAGDPERNETQARAALLDAVHAGPGAGAPDAGTGRARRRRTSRPRAARYARRAGGRSRPRARTCPAFDVLMLGVGPDAHVASLFPEHPALHERDASTVGRARLPQAAARARLADLPRPVRGTRRLVPRLRGGQGQGGRPGPVRLPARCRPPRPVSRGTRVHDLAARPRRRRARAAGAGPASQPLNGDSRRTTAKRASRPLGRGTSCRAWVSRWLTG